MQDLCDLRPVEKVFRLSVIDKLFLSGFEINF